VPALEYAQTLQKRAEKVSDLEVENQKLRETLGRKKQTKTRNLFLKKLFIYI
jgi:cell shape-determining protein MreC